jgi:hypothetical protein
MGHANYTRNPVTMMSHSRSRIWRAFSQHTMNGPLGAYQVQISSGDHGYLLINRSIRSSHTIPIRWQGFQTGAMSPCGLTPRLHLYQLLIKSNFFKNVQFLRMLTIGCVRTSPPIFRLHLQCYPFFFKTQAGF